MHTTRKAQCTQNCNLVVYINEPKAKRRGVLECCETHARKSQITLPLGTFVHSAHLPGQLGKFSTIHEHSSPLMEECTQWEKTHISVPLAQM